MESTDVWGVHAQESEAELTKRDMRRIYILTIKPNVRYTYYDLGGGARNTFLRLSHTTLGL
jgi:hypothetical protein